MATLSQSRCFFMLLCCTIVCATSCSSKQNQTQNLPEEILQTAQAPSTDAAASNEVSADSGSSAESSADDLATAHEVNADSGSSVASPEDDSAAAQADAAKDAVVTETDSALPSGMPKPPCMAAGSFDGKKCVCGKMKYSPEDISQWACLGDYFRCLRSEGCAFQGKNYPALNELKNGVVYCSEDIAPENLEGFRCARRNDLGQVVLYSKIEKKGQTAKADWWRLTTAPTDPKRKYWECVNDQCDCHGISIQKSDICLKDGVFRPGQYIVGYIRLEYSDYASCMDKPYPAKGTSFGYDCRMGQWVCLGKECLCPQKLDINNPDYKTIHFGEICDVDSQISSQKGKTQNTPVIPGCTDGKCRCTSVSRPEMASFDVSDFENNDKCYCGKPWSEPETFEPPCMWCHSDYVTIYCEENIFKDNMGEFNDELGLYTMDLDREVCKEEACEEYDRNVEENKNEGETSSSNDDKTKNQAASEKQKDSSIIDGTRFLYQDQYPICMKYEGCTCGDSKCPMSTACVQNQCIDPVNQSVISAQPKHNFLPSIQCSNAEDCGCSDRLCGKDEWCIAGNCYANIFAVIYQDERIFYNPYGVIHKQLESKSTYRHLKELLDETYYADDFVEGLLNETYDAENFADSGNDAVLKRISPEIRKMMQKGYGYTDILADSYKCCCDEVHFVLGAENDMRCVLPQGCACGNTICQMGGKCQNGKCQYDEHYIDMMCYSNTNTKCIVDNDSFRKEFPDILADDKGNCVCRDTILNPQLFNHHREQYACSDYGWICTENNGCDCGDVKCDKNAVCIAPGLCSQPVSLYQKGVWQSKDRKYCDSADNQDCCFSNVWDYYGGCCDSGVLNKEYECCSSGVLNSDGLCCDEACVKDGKCACPVDATVK